MATYTDLGNRVRENVVVDYHTRETAQCVKLLNDNNEYHGVFKGVSELSAVNVVGGELSGVTLRDVEFAGGIYLPGHTDITDLGKEIANVKQDTDARCRETENGISRVSADLNSAKNSLENRIYDAKRDCESQIQENAGDIKRLEKTHKSDVGVLSDQIIDLRNSTIRMENLGIVSSNLTNQIADVRRDAEDRDSQLSIRVGNISVDAVKAVGIADQATKNLAKTDYNVSQLSDDVDQLSTTMMRHQKDYSNLVTNFNAEKTTRISEDGNLCAAIHGTNTNLTLSVNNLSGWLQRVANVAADTAAGANTWKQPLIDVSTSLSMALELSTQALTAADAMAAMQIENLIEASKQHVSKDSMTASTAGLTAQMYEASSTLSDALENISTILAGGIDDAREEAFAKTDSAAANARQELFGVSTCISADMQLLAGRATQLETDVVQLNVDLAGEKATRSDEDKNLSAKIAANAEKTAEDIALLDETLSRSISEVEQTAAEELAKLAKKTEKDIWAGCHYKIIDDGTKQQWPYKCEDFAVNCYPDAGSDAVVKYYDAVNNETHSIGTIAQKLDGSYVFKTFNEIKPEIVAATVETGKDYFFPADGQPIATNLGCQLQYKPAGDGLNGEIAAAPIAPKYCSLQCGGVQIGKIYDAVFDGSDNLLSGKITIQTADREFASFLGFYAQPFDLDDYREIRVDTEKITYLGNNEFELYSGIEERRRMDLADADTNRVFGYLLSSAAKNPVKYDEDGKIEKITAVVDYADDEVVLERVDGFRKTLSSWADVDGRGWRRVLEADVEEGSPASCSFNVVEESLLKEMPIESIDAEKLLSGCLVPEAWNIENPLALDFGRVGKISAYVSAFVPVEAVQKPCYVLEKRETGNGCDCGCGNPVETVFAASESDGAGNSVDLKFSGRTFHMVVTSADGKVLRYSYAFQSRDEWNDFVSEDSVGSKRIALAESKSGPLAFGGVVEAPAFSWKAKADSRQLLDPREDFTMTVAKTERRIELELPEGTNGRAREFIAMVKPAGNDDLSVVFVDKHGQKLDDSTVVFSRQYGAETSDQFMAPAGQWTAFKIQEIRHGHFVVVDSLDVASKLSRQFEKVDAAISAENARAISAENGISGIVDGLSADLSVAIDKLSVDLSNEISSETTRSTAVEASISGIVDSLSVGLSTAVDELSADLSNWISSEIARAVEAETGISTIVDKLSADLSDRISAENDRAVSAETGISAAVDAVSSAVADLSGKHAAEVERAVEAEKSISDTLEAKTQAIEEALANEVARAEEKENEISSYAQGIEAKCDAEIARAKETENAVSADLNELSASFGEVSADHSARVEKLETEAKATFTKTEYVAGGRDVVTNLLKLVDAKDTTKTYMLLVDDGTLVLSAIEAAN